MLKMKPLEELTLLDDFMFGKVMSRVEISKRFLEQLFQKKIKNITSAQSQSVHQESYEARGVRFDVEFEGDGMLYNIEMQQQGSAGEKGKLALVNRARCYHANLLLGHFKRGDKYVDAPATRVIFICDFDPIGGGDPVYLQTGQIANYQGVIPCQEMTAYLNTRYNKFRVMKDALELMEFLNYIRDGVTMGSTTLSNMAAKAVAEVKTSYEARRDYMSLQEKLDQMYDEGREKGLEEAVSKLVKEFGITETHARKVVGLPSKDSLNLDHVGK